MLEIQTIQFINSLKWNEFKILKGHIYVEEEEIELITASYVVNKDFPGTSAIKSKTNCKSCIIWRNPVLVVPKWGIVYIKHQMII